MSAIFAGMHAQKMRDQSDCVSDIGSDEIRGAYLPYGIRDKWVFI